MIDTIVLTLQQNEFVILDHNMFAPSTIGLYSYPYYRFGKNSYISCHQNGTPSELKNGIYKPRLTVTRRLRQGGFDISMRIEFSVPKLIYGNNFDEVENKDFEEILTKLKQRLLEMGISMKPGFNLADAQVSSIHYAKNIILRDYTTSDMIINEIAKLDMGKRLDINMRDYRNGGSIIKFHCNSYELTFYDKLKDLEQSKISEGRSYEKDNIIQYTLFDDFPKKEPFEIFRIEIRLNKKYKIESEMTKIGYKKIGLTLINLYSEDIAMKIIRSIWNKIIEQSRLQYCGKLSLIELCEETKRLNPHLSSGKIMQIICYMAMAKDVSQRRIRNLIDCGNNQAWYKFVKMLKTVDLPTDESYRFINKVAKELLSYQPIHSQDYII